MCLKRSQDVLDVLKVRFNKTVFKARVQTQPVFEKNKLPSNEACGDKLLLLFYLKILEVHRLPKIGNCMSNKWYGGIIQEL